jgi:hypothetical protein
MPEKESHIQDFQTEARVDTGGGISCGSKEDETEENKEKTLINSENKVEQG